MANSCSKLMKEALDSFLGIDFRYKLDDTLEGLGTQKFTARQLEGYLLKQGVSPKEIKQSGIFDGMIDDNRALPADMWLNKSGSQSIKNSYNKQYSDITLGRKGDFINSEYKTTLSTVKKPSTNEPSTPHFGEYISGKDSILGWRRTHIDEINGKKTLVLNEFQSDWAQTERAGRGMFESNYVADYSPAVQDLIRAEGLTIEELADTSYMRDKISNWLDEDFITEAEAKVSNKTKVADFPMSEVKHHQFQIVGAINDAIKEGIDTVAIPIQRENELAGSAGVTKFYESLNTKILPDIRKKLEKQGLKIKVDKKPYTAIKISKQEQDKIVLDAYNRLNSEAKDTLNWSEIDSLDNLYSKLATIDNTNNSFSNSVDLGYEFYTLYKQGTENDLWTLTIEEVPNGKVKWDVYSILAALGLGGYAKQAEASIATEKDIASMKATKPSKVKDSDSLDLAGFLGGAPEVVNPEKYSNNYKGIKDYIAKIESRGSSNPYIAKSKTSSASGKYQFTNIMVKDLNQKLGITRKDLRSPRVQEQAMEYLIGEYKEALAKFDIPNKKENIFVLHNLGITGGLRALRGTYEPSDIKNMASNLTSDMDKSNRNAIITNYNTLYNVDIPLRSKINKS